MHMHLVSKQRDHTLDTVCMNMKVHPIGILETDRRDTWDMQIADDDDRSPWQGYKKTKIVRITKCNAVDGVGRAGHCWWPFEMGPPLYFNDK